MLRKNRRRLPKLESLESRALLSGTARPELTHPATLRAQIAPAAVRSTAAPRAAGPKGLVASVEPISSTSLLVQFRAKVLKRQAANLRYEVDGLPVERAQLAPDGRSALLTTAPQEDRDYTARVRLSRGKLRAPRILNRGEARFVGDPLPQILDVTVADDRSILVTYNKAMGESALRPENHELVDPSGSRLAITGGRFVDASNRTVALQTEPQSYAAYQLNLLNVADTRGQGVLAGGRQFAGNPKGRPVSVQATSPTTVVVAFNEPMADNALAPQHYAIEGPGGVRLAVTEARFDGPLGMVVTLTTAAQVQADYQLSVANVTDLGNDPIDDTARLSFAGVPSPALAQATPTDPTSVILTFTGPVGDGALSPATYRVEQLSNSGAVVGTLAVRAAGFVGGQRTVVELETGAQAAATYRVTTTQGLTDLAGTSLPSSTATFRSVWARPVLVGIASTGPNTVVATFDQAMSDDALAPGSYAIRKPSGTNLAILGARFVGTERRVVELTTEPQEVGAHTVTAVSATDADGRAATLPSSSSARSFAGRGAPPEEASVAGPPRVVGAASISNTEVLVSFSEPMADNAIRPEHFVIAQENVNPEAGALLVLAAEFHEGNRATVKLTTRSQNELTYRVTVVNATDLVGNALAPAVVSNGVLVNPTSATFPGSPPAGESIVDTDGDGLTDNQELRGWEVVYVTTDRREVRRWITSDLTLADTDGDGLSDQLEAALGIDPRAVDTDFDQLGDYAEYNEIYSNLLDQDSDDDGLDDFVEFDFYRTSPIFDDTDGDQLKDGDEIVGNRNPRVADLPRPELNIGDVNLQLDVRFNETRADERRELETRQVSTTMAASSSRTYSTSDTGTFEFHLDAGYEPGQAGRGAGFVNSGITAGGAWTTNDESASSTQREYQNSLSTDREVTRGFNVERTVQGASMQVAISLRNVSTLAYRVKNIQVTALIQDPIDRTRLTPIATLLPDSEPEEGFTLGPLVTDRGPFIFSNTTIIPSLVESLMANPSGLIFRISNYDIIDESGRNFAFSSRDVIDRTAKMVIDYGGARSLLAQVSGEPIDENQPGDETEILRVAASGGRAIDDTNEDGRVDVEPRELFDWFGNSLGVDYDGDGLITEADDSYVGDTRVVFDGSGKGVGVTLYQALAAAGLTHYDEWATPTANLTDDQILGSFSTFVDASGRERIFRIRGVANDPIIQKFWEILTPLGIDADADLSRLVLAPGSGVSLNFVQDLDGDGLTADVEYFLRTSDSPVLAGADFSRGSVPQFTQLEFDWVYFGGSGGPGWTTGTAVRVSASGGGLTAGTDYYVYRGPFDIYYFFTTKEEALAATSGSQPGRVDLTGDITATIARSISRGRDSDGDGLDDRFEALIGWTVDTPQRSYKVWSSSNRADSNFDGLDDAFAAPGGWDDRDGDGLRDRFNEVYRLPTEGGVTDWVLDPIRPDTDGDGIGDAREIAGYNIVRITGGSVFSVKTDPTNPDTDRDTFSDGFERQVGLDPTDGNDKDTDGDGLPDPVEQAGWAIGRERLILDTSRAVVATSTAYEFVDYLFFNFNPGLTTGDRVRVSATGGGLTAGVDYYVYVDLFEGIAFATLHTTRADALVIANRVDFTAPITAQIIPAELVRGIEAVSTTPYVEGVLNPKTAMSNPNSVDSDGDGLTDFEEFFLNTDPTAADTDGDGIDDILELRGFRLPHKVGGEDLGLITTDPLDADTDNDKRPDGAEAELKDVELSRWVVRVLGQAPYRVYSNPLVADADYDGLVDGDEIAFGTDPNNGNTDGDRRNDRVEVTGGSNPLAEDVRVTVVAQGVLITPAGQYNYALSVRKPDGTGVAGLGRTTDLVYGSDGGSSGEVGKVRVTNSGAYVAKISFVYLVNLPGGGVSYVTTGEESDLLQGQTASYDPGARGVPKGSAFFVRMRAVAGNTITASQILVYGGTTNAAFAKYTSGGTTFIGTSFSYNGIEAPVALPQDVALSRRSVSFGLARDERFSIEGFVTQVTTGGNITVQLGGLEGLRAKRKVSDLTADNRTVFSYLEVANKSIEDYVFQVTVGSATAFLTFYFIID